MRHRGTWRWSIGAGGVGEPRPRTAMCLEHLAQVMKPLAPKVAISTGGSVDLEDSLLPNLFVCPELDIIDIHTYTTNAAKVKEVSHIGATWAVTHGKRVRLQKFGVQGDDTLKMEVIIPIIYGMNELGIPFMPWELVHPENKRDFEFWISGDFWARFTAQSWAAKQKASPFSWPELPQQTVGKDDWSLCVLNAECRSGCCTNEWSDDKLYKCTPGGQRCSGNRLADWVFCTRSSECLSGCCSKQWSDDGRYKCTPGGNPSLCGDALSSNGQPCSSSGACASGCCASGSCVAQAPPALCSV